MENKTLYGVMTLLFTSIGVPQFMNGETGKGIGFICISVFTCGIGAAVLELIGFIQGILILTMSDEAYAEKYLNKKAPAGAAQATAQAAQPAPETTTVQATVVEPAPTDESNPQ